MGEERGRKSGLKRLEGMVEVWSEYTEQNAILSLSQSGFCVSVCVSEAAKPEAAPTENKNQSAYWRQISTHTERDPDLRVHACKTHTIHMNTIHMCLIDSIFSPAPSVDA